VEDLHTPTEKCGQEGEVAILNGGKSFRGQKLPFLVEIHLAYLASLPPFFPFRQFFTRNFQAYM
jgi:hypothetical protein